MGKGTMTILAYESTRGMLKECQYWRCGMFNFLKDIYPEVSLWLGPLPFSSPPPTWVKEAPLIHSAMELDEAERLTMSNNESRDPHQKREFPEFSGEGKRSRRGFPTDWKREGYSKESRKKVLYPLENENEWNSKELFKYWHAHLTHNGWNNMT